MNWYLVAILVQKVLGLGIVLAKDGERRTDRYRFGWSLLFVAIDTWLIIMAIRCGWVW